MWSANREGRPGEEVNPLVSGFVREGLFTTVKKTGNGKGVDTLQLARAAVLRRVIEDAEANALHRIFCRKVKTVSYRARNEDEIEKVKLVAVGSIESLRPDFLIETQELAAGRDVINDVIGLLSVGIDWSHSGRAN